MGLFSAIYKIMPDVHIEWRDMVLGGAVTSALFTIGELVIGLYLGRASFASTHGAAASLCGVYYLGLILQPDLLSGRRIHENLRESVRLTTKPPPRRYGL
jgi:hypothetical protein